MYLYVWLTKKFHKHSFWAYDDEVKHEVYMQDMK